MYKSQEVDGEHKASMTEGCGEWQRCRWCEGR